MTVEGSLEHRNLQAIAAEMKRLRGEYEVRIATLERENLMRKQEIKQLQDLFATQTVMRGSGPTA